MNEISIRLQKAQAASAAIAQLSDGDRARIILEIAARVEKASEALIAENKRDLERMDKNDPKYDRLMLSESRIQSIVGDMRTVAHLPSPLGIILEEKTLRNGIGMKKISVPLGVIGIIYEARPNVTLDAFTLCFKAGSACVLKGGSDAHYSNTALEAIIRDVLTAHKLPNETVILMPPDRESTSQMLNAVGLIDVIIPRGSQGLIDFVRQNSRVPVIETGAGIVHTYFDKSGDLTKGQDIIFNAKTRRVSVCNALDTVLVHEERLADVPALVEKLASKNVQIFADNRAFASLAGHYPETLLAPAKEGHFGTEFLDYKMSIKVVSGLEEALQHIAQYSSKHSEAIIAEDEHVCDTFLSLVDAAVVYANASTAFTDGGQFELGAEIGISTQKLHARGPMALREITSYKWIARGNGQVREG